MTRLSARLAIALAFAVFAGGVVVVGSNDARAATAQPRVLFVGDSTFLALNERAHDPSVFPGFDVSVDVRNCRRAIVTGCLNQTSSALVGLHADRNAADIVVLSVGYNDNRGYDAFVNIIDTLEAEVHTWSPVPTIVWLTMNSWSRDYQDQNTALFDALPRYPNLLVADWRVFAHPHREWFQDGSHVNMAGVPHQIEFLRGSLDTLRLGSTIFSIFGTAAQPTAAVTLTAARPESGGAVRRCFAGACFM